MANASDIEIVRANTNEPDGVPYSDVLIGTLVDELGVAGASATIWRRKAAAYSELVNTREAGASRDLSDLSKTALSMAAGYDLIVKGELGKGHAKSHKIVRL